MNAFAEWLSHTALSAFLQEHNAWTIPMIQTLHIIGIALICGSVFLIGLRLLGLAGMDQTVDQTVRRYSPWVTRTLWLLIATGLLLVVAEPVRELITVSFWLKMALVATGTWLTTGLHARRSAVPLFVAITFLVWVAVIFLGRLIAYDHIWGAWSPATKA